MKNKNIGSKARNLFLLNKLGFRTKPFCVISSKKIKSFSSSDSFLKFVKKNKKIKIDVNKFYAVRSSSSLEDGNQFSYAGAFETLLNVSADNLYEAAKKVCHFDKSIETAYSQKNIEIKMSVIIQEMVESKYSGVCFSRSPKSPTSNIIIEFAKGLGNLVVDGRIETEYVYFDYFLNPINKTSSSCPHSIFKEIAMGAKKLEQEMQIPVDIEWSFDGENLYFLQVRPITSDLPKLDFYLDSNLCESYPRYTTPLTCSLVKILYENAFSNGAKFFKASKNKREKLSPFYKTMIQDFDGHLYYNLKSYQEALVGLPKGQDEFNEWLDLIGFEGKIRMPQPTVKSPNFFETLKIIIILIHFKIFRKKMMIKFFKEAGEHISNLKSLLNKEETNEGILNLINKELLCPQDLFLGIINDRFIMIESDKIRLFAKLKNH